MKKFMTFLSLSVCLVAAGSAVKYQLSQSSEKYAEVDMDELFQQYCGKADRISTEIPYPNYRDELVKKAVVKLNTVAPVSFYMYSGVISSYGFRKGRDKDFPWDTYQEILDNFDNQSFGEKKNWETGESSFDVEYLKEKFDYEYYSSDSRPPSEISLNGSSHKVKGNSHAFLVYLCGEFRDRPTLIKEKLEWIDNMIKLPAVAQTKIDPEVVKQEGKSIWQYVAAESYAFYVTFSREAFAEKERKAWEESRTMKLSEKWNVDKPVPAFTVCEVKYMMTEYISQPNPVDRVFPGYEQYMEGLKKYESAYCTADDTDYYYDFRGDSNLKPNSPESNGMIWHATSILNRCGRNSKGEVWLAKDRNTNQQVDFDIEVCKEYMSQPFSSRWNAARASLTTWTMRNQQFDPTFSDTRSLVSMIPSMTPELNPTSFQFYSDDVYEGSNPANFMDLYASHLVASWTSPDSGYNTVFGVSDSGTSEIDYAYERIKDAVDRHTDWYASGYDDSRIEPTRARTIGQAYSPFVASSYEMSESDAFTFPGITVNGPQDGRRQWMFVFKVHKDKWYNTDSLKAGVKVDFENHWFDETSFGTTHLADTERAWDRLGTPLEGEMESILYLHNIANEKQAIKSMFSAEDYPQVLDDNLGATH